MAAVNNNFGNLLTNTYASNPVAIANTAGSDRPEICGFAAYCAIPASTTDSAGSQYRFFRVKSNDVILQLRFGSTALTAGALSIGLWFTNTGAHVSANAEHLFATSINCASAVPPADNRYTNLALTTAGQRVWELLGLSSDPVTTYDVVAVSTTAATVAGTLYADIIVASGAGG